MRIYSSIMNSYHYWLIIILIIVLICNLYEEIGINNTSFFAIIGLYFIYLNKNNYRIGGSEKTSNKSKYSSKSILSDKVIKRQNIMNNYILKHIDQYKNLHDILKSGLPLNVFMTFDEIKNNIASELSLFYSNKKIISTSEFEKIKENYYTNRYHIQSYRIWSSLYVKTMKSIFNNIEYDAPDYIIVY